MGRMDWRQIAGPGVSVLLLGIALVFAHSALEGERGWRALKEARAEIALLEAELSIVSAERARMANLVRRLGPDYLDLDLLDERARAVLGFARSDELVVRP
ncbi:MAG: septum formation initiator family protein [Pseudomonadota bacterium]